MGTNFDLYKYEYFSPSIGNFLSWIDFSNPSLLGNDFRLDVRKPDQFSDSLGVGF